MKAWRHLFTSAVVVVALALTVTTPATASAASGCHVDTGSVAGKNVVIVIHGWNGTELAKTDALLQTELGTNWVAQTFSYPNVADEWPDKSGAAACLRQVIHAAHDATGSTSANIFIVAHSMGGILARFALDPSADPTLSGIVGGVVTLDTPHNGSPLGGTAWARIAQRGSSGDGFLCLALHHPGTLPAGCGYPPYLPASVPITEVVGDATISRNFFMFGYSNLDTNSDGMVWTNSQSGYSTSADGNTPDAVNTVTVRCETGASNLAPLIAKTITDGYIPFDIFGVVGSQEIANGAPALATNPTAVAVLTSVSQTASCGHTNMTTNPEAIKDAAFALNTMQASADTTPQSPTPSPTPSVDDKTIISAVIVGSSNDKIAPDTYSVHEDPGFFTEVRTPAGLIPSEAQCYVHWDVYNNGNHMDSDDTRCGLDPSWSTSYWPNQLRYSPGTIKVTATITTDWGATAYAEKTYTVR